MSKPPPMITAKSLGAMPQFSVHELGLKKTRAALDTSGLSQRFIDSHDGFISEHALADFIGSISRDMAVDHLGLIWAPHITVADYGVWGRYVLSAPDLETALQRAKNIMPLHSNTDFVDMKIGAREVIYSYQFALPCHSSYPNIAFTAVASILSIPRHFLGPNWNPLRIEFNISKPRQAFMVEDTFNCAVSFGHERLRIFFQKHLLSASNPTFDFEAPTTHQDVLRERASGPPTTLVQSAGELVLQQLSEQIVSLDRTSMSLGISVRTLQRQLNSEGISFRTLVNGIRMQRAQELLNLKGSKVTKVATSLGYSNPNNFSRAFSTHFGVSPKNYLKANL